MFRNSLLALLAQAAVTCACTIPATPPPTTITAPFRLQVQNATQPDVHNKYMNLLPAGGGDGFGRYSKRTGNTDGARRGVV